MTVHIPQSTDTVLMIRPACFRFNDQTAVNNHYQHNDVSESYDLPEEKAIAEFEGLVNLLRTHSIQVNVIDAPADLDMPDAVFPNNWISFHTGGKFGLYSMFAPNRRLERSLLEKLQFINDLDEQFSFVPHEYENRFLEGTGSLVLDRTNKIAFAAISERTDPGLAREFGKIMDYRVVLFRANQQVGNKRLPIYHTNVMMSVGTDFAWICDACIDDEFEREQVIQILAETGRDIIRITETQAASFAGNILEVKNASSEKFVVMSTQAFESLRADQIQSLSRFAKILHSDLKTIETLGGGSARCMIAEIFS